MSNGLVIVDNKVYYLVPHPDAADAYQILPPVGGVAGTIYVTGTPADRWWAARRDAPPDQWYKYPDSAAAKALEKQP